MRTDPRIRKMLKLKKLPCKSTVHNYTKHYFTLPFLVQFNLKLVNKWVKRPIDILLDASGIRLVGRSIWYSIRTKKKIKRKQCDKIHIAVSNCSLLIINFRITKWKKGDSPFLKKLLKPFNQIGKVLADMAYSGKKNVDYVAKKKGAFFSPFKKNADPKGLNTWSYLYKLWNIFPNLCKAIYNQRSRVEAVFSALKRRYGDELYSRKWYLRRREMAMRFIAYNLRLIIAIQISKEKQIPLWVKA
jgi:hypothetical protein